MYCANSLYKLSVLAPSPVLHTPILLDASVAAMLTDPNGFYIDATFGRGGHSQAILKKLNSTGKLFAFDRDPEAVEYGKSSIPDPRFTITHLAFSQLADWVNAQHLTGKINGILFDLGVSSPQLEDPKRGFSFLKNGPLDMRMDSGSGKNLADRLKKIDEKSLIEILRCYGEERYAKRIAKAIIEARRRTPLQTTEELVSIILEAQPRQERNKHPATRCFQAFRIWVNDELKEIEEGLSQSSAFLKKRGRVAVISFHSLEDRLVKQFIRQKMVLKGVGKAIKPDLAEIKTNPRSRSAILRIAEKL